MPANVHEPSAGQPRPADVAVEIRTRLPRSWRDELNAIARERAVSTSDLIRLILRDFLRSGRHP